MKLQTNNLVGDRLNLFLFLYTRHEFVQSALNSSPVPSHLLAAFGQLPGPISTVEHINESPLYCPRKDFFSVKTSSLCSESTLHILQATRSLIDATIRINALPNERRSECAQEFQLLKSQLEGLLKPSKDMQVDYVNESCRLTAEAVSRAVNTNTSFQDLDGDIGEKLKSALQKTDIGFLWGQMSGVLFWVALVGSTIAGVGRPSHSFLDSLLRRLIYELTYKAPVYEVVTIAVANFVQLQEVISASKK